MSPRRTILISSSSDEESYTPGENHKSVAEKNVSTESTASINDTLWTLKYDEITENVIFCIRKSIFCCNDIL